MLHALLINELKDLYHAEKQLLKALRKMAEAATNSDLRVGITDHLAQTRGHVTRLARALKILGRSPKGKPSRAILALVEEGAKAIEMKERAAVRDAALIGVIQRLEQYEMAGYGLARVFAQALGKNHVTGLLQKTLDEEGEINKKLTQISATVNAGALAAGGQISATRKSKRVIP